jgi:hypothetical protein
MDRLKRFAIKKTTDSLDKVLEAKAHFDQREEKKTYIKKIKSLKEVITDGIFHGGPDNTETAYGHIQELDRIMARQIFDSKNKQIVDDLFKKYNHS